MACAYAPCAGTGRARKKLSLDPTDSPVGEGQGRNPSLFTSEQSDRPIVPEKLSNKAPSIPIKSGPRGCGDGGGKGPDQGEPGKVRQVPYSVTEA